MTVESCSSWSRLLAGLSAATRECLAMVADHVHVSVRQLVEDRMCMNRAAVLVGDVHEKVSPHESQWCTVLS